MAEVEGAAAPAGIDLLEDGAVPPHRTELLDDAPAAPVPKASAVEILE